MHARFLVIGGGLSGLAAAIRLARYNDSVVLLEKHHRVGGLNSYFYRERQLFETGLHAITNFADRTEKKAPLNRLLRQLQISRDQLGICPQIKSEIFFPDRETLIFDNEFKTLESEISDKFPNSIDGFHALVSHIDQFDPFTGTFPFISTKEFLDNYLKDSLLTQMLLCPILYYGSSWKNDIDFSQFVIMFRSIFQEGMFRPAGTIKDLLDLLVDKLKIHGGELRLNSGVKSIVTNNDKVTHVVLTDDTEISCDAVVSTIGLQETREITVPSEISEPVERLSFVENIYQLSTVTHPRLPADRTIIFFNNSDSLKFEPPASLVDYRSGVICFPTNFKALDQKKNFEVRTTHLANYHLWSELSYDQSDYKNEKILLSETSLQQTEHYIGSFAEDIIFRDTFTPLTIQRYTGKKEGAIYGSPIKIKSGKTRYENLFIAGTDQGFLGITGAMLSGISIVNQNILAGS